MSLDFAAVFGADERQVFLMPTDVQDNELTQGDYLEMIIASIVECDFGEAAGDAVASGGGWHFRVGVDDLVIATTVFKHSESAV